MVGAVVVVGGFVVEAAVVGSEVADEEEDSGLSTAGDTAEETGDWTRVPVAAAVVVAMEDLGDGGGEVLDNR